MKKAVRRPRRMAARTGPTQAKREERRTRLAPKTAGTKKLGQGVVPRRLATDPLFRTILIAAPPGDGLGRPGRDRVTA